MLFFIIGLDLVNMDRDTDRAWMEEAIMITFLIVKFWISQTSCVFLNCAWFRKKRAQQINLLMSFKWCQIKYQADLFLSGVTDFFFPQGVGNRIRCSEKHFVTQFSGNKPQEEKTREKKQQNGKSWLENMQYGIN